MKTIVIPTNFSINLNFEIPSVGRRVGAFLIDWIIKGGYLLLVFNVMSVRSLPAFLVILVFSPFFFYTLILESLNKGQTIGKLVLKMRVIGLEGNIPSFSQCAIRWVFLLVDCWIFFLLSLVNTVFAMLTVFSPLIGFLFVVRNKNNQRLGDMAANTLIINAEETEFRLDETIYGYMTFEKNYQPMFPAIMKLPDADINRIKIIMEKAEVNYDYELAGRLANRIKEVLKIESSLDNYSFLKQLLKDYNHCSVNQ